MNRRDFAAVARVVWVEPIAYAAHRPLVPVRYPKIYRVLFWALTLSAALAVGLFLVRGGVK